MKPAHITLGVGVEDEYPGLEKLARWTIQKAFDLAGTPALSILQWRVRRDELLRPRLRTPALKFKLFFCNNRTCYGMTVPYEQALVRFFESRTVLEAAYLPKRKFPPLKKGFPVYDINTWQELAVVFVAHETGHLLGAGDGRGMKNAYIGELNCEKLAYATLKSYRAFTYALAVARRSDSRATAPSRGSPETNLSPAP